MLDRLQKYGPVISEDQILHFGNHDQEVARGQQTCGLLYLHKVRPFLLQSPNAKRWCNGMFSNNIRKLQPGQGNRSAICNDRGHVQGFIDVYCTDENEFFCTLEGNDQAWFSKRFGMFMMLDDIEMIDLQDVDVISLQGPTAQQVLQTILQPPSQPHHHLLHEGIRVARKDRSGNGGFDLFVPQDKGFSIFEQLVAAGAHPIGAQAINTLRILSGRARWPEDSTGKSFIHDLVANEECCAFDKGCYVGQEIINRIDVKGLVNKKLTRIKLSEQVPVGTELYYNNKKVGPITSRTQYQSEHYGLAILRKNAWEPGTTLQVQDSSATITTL